MAPPVRRRTFIASAAALPVALYGPLRGPTMNAAPFAQRADVESGVHRRVDSINWYYELRGRGPTVVVTVPRARVEPTAAEGMES